MKKTCTVCNVEKTIDNYSSKKRGLYGKSARCKSCDTEYHRLHREANYEKVRAKEKAYKEANRAQIRIDGREYDRLNKEKIAARKKVFRQNNKKKLAAQKKEYRSKPEIKARDRAYHYNKIKTNLNYKLKNYLRKRINSAMKLNLKSGSAVSDLGCSIEDFKKYLESKFEPWMNWDNHGTYGKIERRWQLDHIIPLCKFDLTDRREFLKACHYTNMQPLGALENYIKNRF